MHNNDNSDEERPIIINISERNEIRKERSIAVAFVLMLVGLAIVIIKNLH